MKNVAGGEWRAGLGELCYLLDGGRRFILTRNHCCYTSGFRPDLLSAGVITLLTKQLVSPAHALYQT